MRTDVVAYVDWNSQIHNAQVRAETDAARRASRTLEFVQRAIASALGAFDKSRYYVTRLRLYHGWHRGITATENKRALDALLEGNAASRLIDRVSFVGNVEFGYNILGVGDHRRCRNISIHLPDTDRKPVSGAEPKSREKMVDTALTCDVLTSARSDPTDWRIILSEDDDFIPVVFLSEAWSKPTGGRTWIMRKTDPSRFLVTEGLILPMSY